MVQPLSGYLWAGSALHESVIAPPRGGDLAADLERRFLTLYEQESRHILHYLHAALHDHTEAEELTAETFFRAWEAWPRFRERGIPPRAWLFRIARNLVIDRSRRVRRTVALEEAEAKGGDDQTAGVATDRHALERALARVSTADRELLLMRTAGLSHAEIGKVQGRSDKAVKVAWHRAMLRLRAQLVE